jgi:hypothetical protein
MEIERNVKIQIVEGEKDPKGNFRAGFSSGPHVSGNLPGYSKAERMLYLGPLFVDRIRSVFAPAQHSEQGNAPDARSAASTIAPMPLRNGW